MCMSIKFKQPFSWKLQDVKFHDGTTKRMIPVWKVLDYHSWSPFKRNYYWTKGWNVSSRTDKRLCAISEENLHVVRRGFHTYLRKKDAELVLKKIGSFVVKCYVAPEDFVAKGWSFSITRQGHTVFKTGTWANSFYDSPAFENWVHCYDSPALGKLPNLAKFTNENWVHCAYPTLVSMRVFIPDLS